MARPPLLCKEGSAFGSIVPEFLCCQDAPHEPDQPAVTGAQLWLPATDIRHGRRTVAYTVFPQPSGAARLWHVADPDPNYSVPGFVGSRRRRSAAKRDGFCRG